MRGHAEYIDRCPLLVVQWLSSGLESNRGGGGFGRNRNFEREHRQCRISKKKPQNTDTKSKRKPRYVGEISKLLEILESRQP